MRKSKYTIELLKPLVDESVSFASVIHKLGLKLTGGNYRYIKFKIEELNLDTSHFKGRGWSKNLSHTNSSSVSQCRDKLRRTNDEVFKKDSPEKSGTKIRMRLLDLGWEYKCSCCLLVEWMGKKISIHVDHINGDNRDNRFSNLRFLCPNCHAQTNTFGAKNIKSYDRK